MDSHFPSKVEEAKEVEYVRGMKRPPFPSSAPRAESTQYARAYVKPGLAIFHPGTFHGTFRPVSTGIR
jgi:hypothetical protein